MKAMKTKAIIAVVCAIFCVAGLSSCGKKEFDRLAENGSEQKDILEIRHLTVEPDYEYQLYLSDDVVLGEVIEELGSEYTNPDGTKDIVNAWQTKYVVRVDKSYKGFVTEGEEIEVITWNKIGISPEDEEKYEIDSDEKEFYLHKGQRGVFMLNYDESDGLYDIVFEEEGLFELKETDTASIKEEGSEIYSSPSVEITLDQIPDDIKKADELYKSSDNEADDE